MLHDEYLTFAARCCQQDSTCARSAWRETLWMASEEIKFDQTFLFLLNILYGCNYPRIEYSYFSFRGAKVGFPLVLLQSKTTFGSRMWHTCYHCGRAAYPAFSQRDELFFPIQCFSNTSLYINSTGHLVYKNQKGTQNSTVSGDLSFDETTDHSQTCVLKAQKRTHLTSDAIQQSSIRISFDLMKVNSDPRTVPAKTNISPHAVPAEISVSSHLRNI